MCVDVSVSVLGLCVCDTHSVQHGALTAHSSSSEGRDKPKGVTKLTGPSFLKLFISQISPLRDSLRPWMSTKTPVKRCSTVMSVHFPSSWDKCALLNYRNRSNRWNVAPKWAYIGDIWLWPRGGMCLGNKLHVLIVFKIALSQKKLYRVDEHSPLLYKNVK